MAEKKNRTIVLMGAGSVLDFGAPKTEELTLALLKHEDVGGINKDIFFLLEKNEVYADINFESIIHFLDSLINYLRSDFKSGFKDIYQAFTFLDENFLKKLELVDKIQFLEGGNQFREKHYRRAVKLLFFNYYKILMPQLTPYCDAWSVTHKKNKNLKNWYLKESEKSVLRIYTTNYDRLIPNLLSKSGINVFDGFQYQSDYDYLSVKPDLFGILNKLDIAVHYNLHGSLYWSLAFNQIKYWKSNQTELYGADSFQKNYSNSEPNHANFLIPVITGYAKLRKAQVSPIREFFNAFQKDLLLADKIIIAGYSFSDDHINNLLSTACLYNQNVQIEIVDYDEKGSNKNISKRLREKVKKMNQNKIIYHMKGFSQYLQ
ncbi:SIR2 family protein [Marivirga tractuosa]|uniref:SIR2 family protein n=1 Tax=Marivirga tractuosa TaxID=1006 RepID=UPI0035CEB9E4